VSRRVDIVLVSLGTTLGWRVGDRDFMERLRAAGVSAEAVGIRFGLTGRLRRGYPANDLVEMVAVRRAALAAMRAYEPRAIVFSTTTAAMLVPRLGVPYAVRLDAPARLNRPGALNAPLRRLERRGLAGARVVLPWSRAAAQELPAGSAPAIVVPPGIEPSGPQPPRRERLAVAYVPDPKSKGLDVVCAGWADAGVRDARLAVFGVEEDAGRSHLQRRGVPEPPGVEWRGLVPITEFRAALRGARVYVGGAIWEDFGQAPLEALADGALLATVVSGGPFEALALARELDPRLVGEGLDPRALGRAVRRAFELPDEAAEAYRRRAAELVAPYRPAAVQAVVEREVIPALLG
jgi:hypothetical protein